LRSGRLPVPRPQRARLLTLFLLRSLSVRVGARGQPGGPSPPCGPDPAAEPDLGRRGVENAHDLGTKVRRVVRLRRLLRPCPRLRLSAASGKGASESGGQKRGRGGREEGGHEGMKTYWKFEASA
jgi:hypothetical protein